MPQNAVTNLGIYAQNSLVAATTSVVYYIRNSASGSGPSLWRIMGNLAPQEIIEGVEGLQVQYGEDLDGDRLVDLYRNADTVTNWDNVLAVTVAVLMRSGGRRRSAGGGQQPDVQFVRNDRRPLHGPPPTHRVYHHCCDSQSRALNSGMHMRLKTPAPHGQRGAILVTALLLLLTLTIIGVSVVQMTRMQERMAGNARDLNLAFQGAEAALREGEQQIFDALARPDNLHGHALRRLPARFPACAQQPDRCLVGCKRSGICN